MTTETTATYRIAPMEKHHLFDIDPSTQPPALCAAYLYLDPGDGTLWTETRYQIDGTPSDVWHNLVLRFQLPAATDAAALADAINAGEIDPLVTRIVDGYECAWNGNNHVGRYNDDADQAIIDLEQWCIEDAPELTGENAGVWYAYDWFDFTSAADLGITADTDDDQLAQLADAADVEALREDVIVTGTYDHFERLRAALIAAREEGDDES